MRCLFVLQKALKAKHPVLWHHHAARPGTHGAGSMATFTIRLLPKPWALASLAHRGAPVLMPGLPASCDPNPPGCRVTREDRTVSPSTGPYCPAKRHRFRGHTLVSPDAKPPWAPSTALPFNPCNQHGEPLVAEEWPGVTQQARANSDRSPQLSGALAPGPQPPV